MGAANGIAIGRPYFLRFRDHIPKTKLDPKAIPFEIEKLRRAFDKAKEDWQRALTRQVGAGTKEVQILESYLALIQDKILWQQTKQTIEQQGINAFWALEKTKEQLTRSVKNKENLLVLLHNLI